MTGAILWGAASLLMFNAGFIGLIIVCQRWMRKHQPARPFMDPAIREDREVEALELIWALPSRDPEQAA